MTRGAGGMVLFEKDGPGEAVATPRREVFDVQGAGDTAIAVLCLARLAGGTLLEAALLAHAASAVVVGRIGTAAASRDELRARIPEVVQAFREST